MPEATATLSELFIPCIGINMRSVACAMSDASSPSGSLPTSTAYETLGSTVNCVSGTNDGSLSNARTRTSSLRKRSMTSNGSRVCDHGIVSSAPSDTLAISGRWHACISRQIEMIHAKRIGIAEHRSDVVRLRILCAIKKSITLCIS